MSRSKIRLQSIAFQCKQPEECKQEIYEAWERHIIEGDSQKQS